MGVWKCAIFFNWILWLSFYSFVAFFGNLNLIIMWKFSNTMRGLSNSLLEFSSLISVFIHSLLDSNSSKGLPYFWGTQNLCLDLKTECLCIPLSSSSSILIRLSLSSLADCIFSSSCFFSSFSLNFHSINPFPRLDFPFTLSASPNSASLIQVHFCQGCQIIPFPVSSHSSEVVFKAVLSTRNETQTL